MKQLILLAILTLHFSFTNAQNKTFSLDDFYSDNQDLENSVFTIFQKLTDAERVAQMIVACAGELGKPNKEITKLVKENKVGGIVFLKGLAKNHKKQIDNLNAIVEKQGQLPILYSTDAEPSLFNNQFRDAPKVSKTNTIKTVEACDSVVKIIDNTLLNTGFRQNFAPVCDISLNNAAIKNRSFGNDKNQVIALSKQFIKTTQADGIVATAKHFPGHGLVVGDTHKKSVYIDGDLKEIDVYKPLIDAGVLSIMVAHITIKDNPEYDTNGLPSSCSKNIVTSLLREKMGFKGLITTDALNIMKAVTVIKNAPLLASKAGNDMLLMPINETKTISSILKELKKDTNYKSQVYESVMRIIRIKLCLGLIKV